MSNLSRPPVVTIMGHVDHGKTTLLDYIRQSRVTEGEAGGITQHIGAYNIEFNGQPITFIDTPGHAAFNKMRQRGADVTDLIILVVAANDGVQPQTEESIRHIKQSGVPFVVAINKIDLPDVDPNIAKSELAEHDVVVTEYGGEIDAVEISATEGTNVDKLLETLLIMAELEELEADPQAPLEAVVIESAKTQYRGCVATVIVQQGTLTTKMDIVAGGIEGRVKQLTDEHGDSLDQVTPGFPAEIMSFDQAPAVGSIVRDLSAEYPDVEVEDITEEPEDYDDPWAEMDFAAMIAAEGQPQLKLIIKADVEGTLEAIIQNLDEDSTELIDSGVGGVTESDVDLAEASEATIIAFQTKATNKIKRLAKERGVRIKQYQVIYKLIEDLQKQMLRLLEPTIDETVTGEAEILKVFEINNNKVAGIRVKTGEINKNDKLHLKRDEEIIADPVIRSMQHGKDDIDRVTAKSEAGLSFKNKGLDFKVGDTIVAYTTEDDDF